MKAKILLVDDRPENLMALDAVLEPLGHDLVRASSGEEALKQLLRDEFALIILDVQMPDLNGFELAEIIKGRAKTSHVPIIFVTAINKEDYYVFKGYSVGAVDYMFKPFDPDILKSKVQVFVDLYLKTKKIEEQAGLLRQAEQREREAERQEVERASIQRYRNLADAIPNIVWTARADGTLDYFNQRWYDFTGLSEADSKRDGWQAVLHEDDLARDMREWEEARRTGIPVKIESRLRQYDGSYRWHMIQALPEIDEHGAIIAWLGTCTDIDDRIRTEQELQAATNQLRDRNQVIEAEVALRTRELATQKRLVERIVDTAPAGIAFVDNQMTCRVVNSEFVRLTGIPGKDLIDQPASQIFSRCPELPQPFLDGVFNFQEPFRVIGFPFVLNGPEGEETTYWDILSYPVLDENQNVDGVLIFSLEVSDRVENEHLQREQIEHLQQIDNIKDEFLSVISHELRTPLNFIMGFASVLGDQVAGPMNESQQHYVEKILNGADRMLILVNDLLDFAKIQAGKFELSPSPEQYSPVIDEVLATLKPLADQKRISLISDVRDSVVANIDSQRVLQLLTNLVGNAIKFTPDGGVVQVRVFSEGDEVITEVEDTGVGFSQDDQSKLFTRFKQLDMSMTREAGGTGLGLSITKALVEAHQGKICASSSGLGKGATFRFTLPLAPATVS
jgi:PAS domain S-box-containing protein